MNKPSNDFRHEFNAFVENQREVRRSMFELFAMEAGVDGRTGNIEYWGKRAAALGKPRRRGAHLHTNLFQQPMTAFQLKRAGKRPRKQRMKLSRKVIFQP